MEKLTKLERLEFSNNEITSLEPCLGFLVNIQTLKAKNNQINSLPCGIGNLTNL